MNNVEKAISILLETNPFYAQFFLRCKIEYDKHNIPTAAACLTKDCVKMIFNTGFMSKLSPEEVGAVVEHEVLHILFQHVNCFLENKEINKRYANVAMDCSINQFIENLPEGGITLGGLSSALKVELEPEQTWLYYYSKIIENEKNLPESTDSFDIHDLQTENMTSQQKAVLKSAVDAAIKAAKGNVPKAIIKVYDSLGDEGKLPWQQLLSNFVARATTTSFRYTRKKTNRRFGIDQPGKIKKRELILSVCVDSSGSVSDEAFESFLCEVSRISKLCQKVYLIDADSAVQSVIAIAKGKKFQRSRHGYGGTSYQPAISKAVELKSDAIIYFGDFDCADTPVDPGVPFLWVGVGDQAPPAEFGKVVRL